MSADTVAFARWLMEHDPANEPIVVKRVGAYLVAMSPDESDVAPFELCHLYADVGGVSWQSLTECLFAAAHAYAEKGPLR